jgi:hypothetical protein
MSLPAGQQRKLNSMEQSLRTREPRLASMFEIFNRLTAGEGWPAWEQLTTAARRRVWREGIRARLRGRGPAGGRSAPRRRPGVRTGLSRVLVLCPLLTLLAILGLLVGLGSQLVPAACRTAASVTLHVDQVGKQSCRATSPELPAK